MWNNSLVFGREEVAEIKWINKRFGQRWRQTGPAVWNKTGARKLSEAKDKGSDGMNGANCFACHNIDPAGFKWQKEDWCCRSTVLCAADVKTVIVTVALWGASVSTSERDQTCWPSSIHRGGWGWQRWAGGSPREDHFDFVSQRAAWPLVMLSLQTWPQRKAFMLLGEVKQFVGNELQEWPLFELRRWRWQNFPFVFWLSLFHSVTW